METSAQTHQSLPAPAPLRPPAEDAVSSRLGGAEGPLGSRKVEVQQPGNLINAGKSWLPLLPALQDAQT